MDMNKVINRLVELRPDLEIEFIDPEPADRVALQQFLMRNYRISEEEAEKLIHRAEQDL
ncbi:MAG: hypothetical protein WD356_07140 [Pseudomonadales bacterium]